MTAACKPAAHTTGADPMILSNASYSAEHTRKKAKERPEKLLTDRSAYILYLESQLERVTAACMTVHSFEERLEDATSRVQALEEKVLNTGRLARCVQEDAEEADAAQQSAQHQLQQRLAALEQAVAGLPRHEDWLAPKEAIDASMLQERRGESGKLQIKAAPPQQAACSSDASSQLQSLAELLTPRQATEVQEAVDDVQSAFAEIRASLAAMRQTSRDCSGGAPALAQRPAHEALAVSPSRRRQQQQQQQRRQQEQQQQHKQQPPARRQPPASRMLDQHGWPSVQREQVDSPDRLPERDWQGSAAGCDEPQPRSSWLPAQAAARPAAPPFGAQRMRRSQHAAAARGADGIAEPRFRASDEAQHQHPQQQRPGDQQHRWHWRAEAAALHLEQAARRQEAEANYVAELNPAVTTAWQGARPGAAGDAAMPRMQGSRHYADENQQADAASPGRRAGSAAAAQWRSASPAKRGNAGHSSAAESAKASGIDNDAGRLHRQQRLQQMYQEIQLLDGDAS